MTKISLLIPTRKRVNQLKRLFDSISETTRNLNHIEVILYIDDDDVESQSIEENRFQIKKIIGPRQSMGANNTACYKASTGDILFLCNDDVIIRTTGWDNSIISVHKKNDGGIYLAYPNDLNQGEKLATFPILSRQCCETLQDPFPTEYQGDFIDAHLLDIFIRLKHKKLQRIYYLKDVIFEHMHFKIGKSENDDTYRARPRFVDDAAFLSLSAQRRSAATRLIHLINGKSPPPLAPPTSRIPMTSIQGTFRQLLRHIIRDSSLPWRRRFQLFHLLLTRYFASHN